MPPSAPLDALLALMQAGDMHALDQLTRTYGDRLLAVARRRCHLPTDAEDAVQQALLAAGTSMTGFRGEGSPLAWLSTLVARSCYRMNQRIVPADDVELAALPCSCEDPATQAERREIGERLGEALMSLSRTDRLAFLLAAEGTSSVEIAARFGLSHDAVRSRLKRARKILRARLDDTDPRASSTSSMEGALHADDDPYPPPLDR